MKKFIVNILVTVCVLLIMITVAEATTKKAPEKEYAVRYTTMHVQEGMTLSELAKTFWDENPYKNSTRWNSYKDLLDEICTSSNIKNPDLIKVGDMISVPYLVDASQPEIIPEQYIPEKVIPESYK